MPNMIIQFNLYYLLREMANDEFDLIGIKLINEGSSYLMGVSWQVNNNKHYRSFNDLSIELLTALYLPKITSIRPHWQEQLNLWAKQPTNILSIGKLG